MSTASIIEKIINVLERSKTVTWEHIYDIYENQEKPKWLEQHGEPMTSKHFNKAKTFFGAKVWYEGMISIADLYQVNLCLNTPWIQELACPSHLPQSCPNCTDPTLEQLVKNIGANRESQWYSKIHSLQESFIKGELKDVFVVIVDSNPPYIYDGNSRLMSIASLPNTQNYKIKCYLGCNPKQCPGVG